MRYLTVIRHCSAPVATTLALIVALTVSACAGASSGTSSGTSSGASPAATATTPTTPLIYTVDATGNPSVLTSETSHLNALDTQTGKQAWSVQIPGEASFLGAAVLLNGVLYADSSDITGATPTVSGTGHVSAFNPQTGKLLWQHDSPNLNFDALLTDGSTLVALMGPTAGGQTINPVLVGINPSDGSQLWQKPLGNVSGTPYVVVTSGMVVTATQTRINGQKTTLRAFNASTGATAWSVSVAGFIGNLTAGSAGIFAGVNSSTTGTGQVVAYSAQTGAQMWQKTLAGDGTVVAAAPGAVYADEVSSAKTQIIALNPNTGAQSWQTPLPITGTQGSQSWADSQSFFSIALGASGETLTELGATSGNQIWSKTLQGNAFPLMFSKNGTLYLALSAFTTGSTTATFAAFNEQTGAQSWSVPVPGYIFGILE